MRFRNLVNEEAMAHREAFAPRINKQGTNVFQITLPLTAYKSGSNITHALM